MYKPKGYYKEGPSIWHIDISETGLMSQPQVELCSMLLSSRSGDKDTEYIL